jgi:hypothetical protein
MIETENKVPPGWVSVPIGYEWTGEIRKPLNGEIFMDHDGVFTAYRDFLNNEWPILKDVRAELTMKNPE